MAVSCRVLLHAHAHSIPNALASRFGDARGVASCSGLKGWPVELKAASPLAMVAMAPSGMSFKLGQRWSMEQRWQEFFEDPSQWWDSSVDKVNHGAWSSTCMRFLKILHNGGTTAAARPIRDHLTIDTSSTRKWSFWVDGRLNPPWVKEKLAAFVTQGQGECEGKYPTTHNRDKEKLWKEYLQTQVNGGTIEAKGAWLMKSWEQFSIGTSLR